MLRPRLLHTRSPASASPTSRPPGRARRSAARIALGFALAAVGAASARADDAGGGADTLRVRFEVGAGSDVTNEQFYEDAFVDTLALGRRLVSDPETRVTSLVRGLLEGTRDDRATGYRLQGEAAIGNRITRGEGTLDWRHVASELWRWSVTPRAEYRRDHTFGRDLEEARASGSARLRRAVPEHLGAVELAAQGEWFRTRGVGADFLPDRNSAQVSASLERSPLFGPEWQFDYGATWRDFPDSSIRNHLEHRIEGHGRWDLAGGHSIEGGAELTRRTTFGSAPTSRDNFRSYEVTAEPAVAMGDAWSLRIRSSAELLRYDRPDSAIFFDYDVYRVEIAPQRAARSWTVRFGPRAELLASPRQRSEEYREIAGLLEVEWIPDAGWWSLTPIAGWRDYTHDEPGTDSALGTLPTPSTRSSYAFYELDALVEQSLPASMRLHFYGAGRLERHTDGAQDAASLYISCELRRLF